MNTSLREARASHDDLICSKCLAITRSNIGFVYSTPPNRPKKGNRFQMNSPLWISSVRPSTLLKMNSSRA